MLGRRVIGLCVAAFAVTLAGSASGQAVFNLTGSWYQNRGPLVDIPINGAPAGCGLFGGNVLPGTPMNPGRSNLGFPDGAHPAAGVIPAPASLAGQPNAGCVGIPNEPATPTTFNPNVGAAPTKGGIPALPAGRATVNPGAAPRSFTVAPDGFGQNLGRQIVAVAVAPTVIQLASTFSLLGPINRAVAQTVTSPLGSTAFIPAGPANDRNFRANAWLGQAGRIAANFTWCPAGTQNPACTRAANAGVTGTYPYNGLIRYRAGTNAFGGTMAMLLGGTGNVSVKVGPPTGGGAQQIAHQPVGGVGLQHPGAGYAYMDTAMLGAAPGHPSYVLNFPCTNPLPAQPAGCSQIVSSPPSTNPAALPASTNINLGMPWTTGTVTAINTGPAILPMSTTLTAMGSDSRDPMGAGNITLVAGGLSHRPLSGLNFSAMDVVTMTFVPEPSSGLLALTVLGVLSALRRRESVR